ncbi:HesB/YadR/YfhF family protein [Caldibacillus lycopersici]|uniref:HesB/YadR/YfhF family protein n=1 Tax=Perspicuibacillus lycopersici TaxID=1325689 RepID=A0AAE3IR79_9BACI|nr:iron-sulfur cluster biosynthesis family protein [Perspicuibacillus lycopersici]MCU9612004.1 HesB/YadR/YfhF family protein [Perspicuibacillus lycopersici]
MNITISPAAVAWFQEEIGIQKGDKVKFFTQIYGSSPIQKGYSLGFTKDNDPIDMAVSTISEGIEFYVEASDLWFFNDYNLVVEYNEAFDEIEFNYSKE